MKANYSKWSLSFIYLITQRPAMLPGDIESGWRDESEIPGGALDAPATDAAAAVAHERHDPLLTTRPGSLPLRRPVVA